MSNNLRSNYDALKNDFRSNIKGSANQLQRNQQMAQRQYQQQMQALGQQMKQTEHERRMKHQMLARQHQQQKQLMQQKHRELLRLKQQLKEISQHEQTQKQKESQLNKRRARLNEIANDFDNRHQQIATERGRLEQQKQKILNYMENFDELSQNPMNVPPDFGMYPSAPDFGPFGGNGMNYNDDTYLDRVVVDYSNRKSRKRQRRRSQSPDYNQPRRQTRHKSRARSARPPREDRGRSKSRRRRKTRRRENADPKSGNLYVRLANARGIFGHRGSKPNTYVEMECDGDVQVSSTKKHNSDPEWNEFFKFRVKNFETSTLSIRLIEAHSGKSITKMKVSVREFVDKVNNNHQPKSYGMGNKVNMDLDIQYERGGRGVVKGILKNR